MLKKYFSFFCLLIAINTANADYSMSLAGGSFYGPGKMPDVKMPDGYISVIQLKDDLSGTTPFFNNGNKPPNISSGSHSEIWSLGVLSDGVQFNENMDGGVVEVGDGALKLLSVVTKDGALKGEQTYQLDSQCNWIISTDLALDPGFAQGIIFARGLAITTGLVITPHSLQSKMSMPGGIDSAGSLPSGTPLLGRLGDFDFDGKLDGVIVGAANIPLEHIFYPGAAVVQSRNFKTDIPISPFDAATLGMLGLEAYLQVFELTKTDSIASPAMVAYLKNNTEYYLEDIRLRLRAATYHLSNDVLDKTVKEAGSEPNIKKLSLLIDGLIANYDSTSTAGADAALVRVRHLLAKAVSLAKQLRPQLSYSCS